ncbi:MAG: ABC transporter ATP-binding protein [Myxococcales bacterium]|nr:MAG: ABC transporter ATP-binding protein [Myxococcales bacterium]
MLKLQQVSVRRDGRALLEDVTLTVGRGELLALVGPNGAGKTTILRAMLGLAAPTHGAVWLGEASLGSYSARQRAAHVAWLPQHSSGGEELPALEVVMAARFRFEEPLAACEQEARAALARVGAEAVATRALGSLSGGERQRVALAALLAQSAPILLADEPANHLDPAQQIDVYRLLGELWRGGKTVVCVTHDVNLLRHLGEPARVRVAGVAQGRLRFELPLDSSELPSALGELFGLHMHALVLNGQRVLLPERSA